MVSLMHINKISNAVHLVGLSTDTKPVNEVPYLTGKLAVVNGSVYQCIDTGDVYTFDEDNSTWHLSGNTSGGGSLPSATYLTE